MPVATISSSTVKVQEQTFQAFLNWFRIAPDFLWHSSPGRNAEGNLHTLPEVSLRGAGGRFETSMEVNIQEYMWSLYSILFPDSFFKKQKIYQKRNRTHCHYFFGWGEQSLRFSNSLIKSGAARRTEYSLDIHAAPLGRSVFLN